VIAGYVRGSDVAVNKGRYVPLMTVTIADNIVILIITIRPIFVERGICSFQKARAGTTAKMTSVNVVYAQSQ
jgi:hypothetical protein